MAGFIEVAYTPPATSHWGVLATPEQAPVDWLETFDRLPPWGRLGVEQPENGWLTERGVTGWGRSATTARQARPWLTERPVSHWGRIYMGGVPLDNVLPTGTHVDVGLQGVPLPPMRLTSRFTYLRADMGQGVEQAVYAFVPDPQYGYDVEVRGERIDGTMFSRMDEHRPADPYYEVILRGTDVANRVAMPTGVTNRQRTNPSNPMSTITVRRVETRIRLNGVYDSNAMRTDMFDPGPWGEWHTGFEYDPMTGRGGAPAEERHDIVYRRVQPRVVRSTVNSQHWGARLLWDQGYGGCLYDYDTYYRPNPTSAATLVHSSHDSSHQGSLPFPYREQGPFFPQANIALGVVPDLRTVPMAQVSGRVRVRAAVLTPANLPISETLLNNYFYARTSFIPQVIGYTADPRPRDRWNPIDWPNPPGPWTSTEWTNPWF